MAPGSRLQELTAKYMQNPRRFFVPLANEYRQANDLDRAIALCREHLPAQPGHMSGHIVLGRAYFEKGDIDAAREVFLTSVALDDENAIALRHLGDIARLRGQPSEARQWYARVLDADPENAEIERLLRSLGGSSPTPLSAAAVMPAPPLGSQPPLTSTLRPPSTFALADAAEALAEPTPPGLKAILGEALDEPSMPAPEPLAATAPALEILDASELDAASGTSDDAVEPIVVADGFGFRFDDLDEISEAVPAIGAFAPPETLPSVDEADFSAGVSTPAHQEAVHPADVAPVVESAAPAAAPSLADDLLSRPAFGALASFASWRTARERETPAAGAPTISPTPTVPPAHTPQPYVDLAAGVLFDDDAQVDAAETAPEFVTETMAQLYVQQGFLQQALDVYRVLAERSPANPTISARIAELEVALAPAAPPDGPSSDELAETQLVADADAALAFDDVVEPTAGDESDAVSILELMYDAAPPPAPERPAEPVATWEDAAPSSAVEDDWFADAALESGADSGVQEDAIYGVSMDGFGTTSAPETFDAAVTAAAGPVTSLETLFGSGTVIAPADATAGDILVSLAGQMVGRLPKELPALPVPDVLDLPTTIPGEEGQAPSPAPLLSFDRFFSGSGAPPRQRVDTPAASAPVVPPRPAAPLQPSPSLSPTFGGVPVIPPPPLGTPPVWSRDDRPSGVDTPRQSTPAVPASAPVQPTPAPAPEPTRAPEAPMPSWMSLTPDAPQAAIPAEPVAPAPLPPIEPPTPPAAAAHDAAAPEEPKRAAPSEFHRWLEGLS